MSLLIIGSSHGSVLPCADAQSQDFFSSLLSIWLEGLLSVGLHTRRVNALVRPIAALSRAVSYTHLDVYKRQAWRRFELALTGSVVCARSLESAAIGRTLSLIHI